MNKTILIWFLFAICGTCVLAQNGVIAKEMARAYEHLKMSPSSDQDSILNLCNRVLLSEKNIDPEIRQGIQMISSEINLNKKKYDIALRNAQAAQATYQSIHADKTNYWINSQLGRLFYLRGNYLFSAQSFSEALRSEEIKSNPSLENEIREYIVRIYNIQPTFNLPENFFEKSIEVKSKLGDEKGILMLTPKMTQMYYEKENYTGCIQSADFGIKYAQKLKDADIEFGHLIDKANSLTRLNKISEAESLLHETQEKFAPTDYHKLSRLETAWGNFYLARKDEKQAIIHYQNALPARNAGPVLEQYVYKHQAAAYKLAGNYQKSLEAHEKYSKQLYAAYVSSVLPYVISIEESKAKSNLNEQIKLLHIQNQLKDSLLIHQKLLAEALKEKNEYQQNQIYDQEKLSSSLHREMSLQQQQVASERNLRILFGLGSIGLLGMGLWIYSLYRKQKSKNSIIEKKSAENELLMKEIHHRVKNNLQIISSLLDMQSLTLKDETAAEAIKEGKNRVQSMALIHQNLYHDGNIRSIKIDDYLKHLAQSLFDSYRIENDKIRLDTDIAPMHLDVETVVPLGIIVNELITNTIKYAFEKSKSGSVFISLHPNGNDTLHFKLKDDGKGFPVGWSPESNHSFGYQLIKAFAKKLKAKLSVQNNPGAEIDLIISKYKTA